MNQRKVSFLVLAALLSLLLLLFYLGVDPYTLLAFSIFLPFLLAIQYAFLKFLRFRYLAACERSFPNFLRDLAEARRSGLNLIEAIKLCSRNDYGTLSKEVKKLKDQLSWNIPLHEALGSFRSRLGKSSVIAYATLILEQAERSGGNVSLILDSLADNMESLKEIEAETRALMRTHVTSLYAIFFIFLGISAALIRFLVPLVQTQVAAEAMPFGMLAGSPCSACVGKSEASCLICNFYFELCRLFHFGSESELACYMKSLFLTMILIMGASTGVVIGQIAEFRAIAGFKHSLILVLAGFFIFVSLSMLKVI